MFCAACALDVTDKSMIISQEYPLQAGVAISRIIIKE